MSTTSSFGENALLITENQTDPDPNTTGPRRKVKRRTWQTVIWFVVLLALAKILGLEEGFSREWRLEERMTGQRLPRLIERLAWTAGRMPGKQSGELSARIKSTALSVSTGETSDAFLALQTLTPRIEAGGHADAPLVVQLLQGTRNIERPHLALLILLALATRKVLLTRR